MSRHRAKHYRRRKRSSGWPAAIAVLVGGAYAWTQLPTPDLRSPDEIAAIEGSVTYSGCNEVREAGKAPIRAGEPGYRDYMDGDGDGLACEPIR